MKKDIPGASEQQVHRAILPEKVDAGSSIRLVVAFGVGLLAAASAAPAKASLLEVVEPVNFIDDYGVNPIGNGPVIGVTGYYSGGEYDSVGAISITPVTGTTVTATQGSSTYNIPYLGGGAFPNQFYRNLPVNSALTGSWTLTVTNAGASNSGLVVSTPALGVTTPPPPVTGVTISGSGTAPTINWSVPAGSSATSEVVYIFQIGSPGAAFASASLPAGAATFTVPPGVLTPGASYSISVQSQIGSQAESRQFTAAFVASAGTIATPVYLPSVSPTLSAFGGPIFDFDIDVTAGVPILIDPAVATGYIYQTGAGNPNFASVELPNIGNPNPYELLVWDGTAFVVVDASLAADTIYDFASGGVSEFEVFGIDPSLGLDPNNTLAFVTDLTFVGDGSFTGTVTPVTEDVPEPATLALFSSALLGLLAACHFKRGWTAACPTCGASTGWRRIDQVG